MSNKFGGDCDGPTVSLCNSRVRKVAGNGLLGLGCQVTIHDGDMEPVPVVSVGVEYSFVVICSCDLWGGGGFWGLCLVY